MSESLSAISDSDVLLAAASDAIIVGFNVRPTSTARKMAENEEVDIRIYSIIYDTINEIKSAMAGMLSPEIKEEVTATLEGLQTFRISKVGTIAGCIVREGKAKRYIRPSGGRQFPSLIYKQIVPALRHKRRAWQNRR